MTVDITLLSKITQERNIGGEWVDSVKRRTVEVEVPATGETIAEIARAGIFFSGQVLSIFRYDDEEEAIANGARYGLAAGVFTQDLGSAHRIAGRLAAGQVYVNKWFAGGIETPFGGVGDSGFGVEIRTQVLNGMLHGSLLRSAVTIANIGLTTDHAGLISSMTLAYGSDLVYKLYT